VGLEARCPARVRDAAGERAGPAKALLETEELILRADGPDGVRARVPRAAIAEIVDRNGVLTVRWDGGAVELTLGAAAAKWASKLREAPKPAVDKLDVKPGMTVSAVDVDDDELLAQLDARVARLVRGAVAPGSDVVLLGVTRAADLDAIAPAARAMADRGALWVLHPRGVPEVQDTAIFAAAKAVGLTYTKVARVSATHTAEKLVRPRS
jgi:hypothetical protein